METTNDKAQIEVAVQASRQAQADKWLERGVDTAVKVTLPPKKFFQGIGQGLKIVWNS